MCRRRSTPIGRPNRSSSVCADRAQPMRPGPSGSSTRRPRRDVGHVDAGVRTDESVLRLDDQMIGRLPDDPARFALRGRPRVVLACLGRRRSVLRLSRRSSARSPRRRRGSIVAHSAISAPMSSPGDDLAACPSTGMMRDLTRHGAITVLRESCGFLRPGHDRVAYHCAQPSASTRPCGDASASSRTKTSMRSAIDLRDADGRHLVSDRRQQRGRPVP